MRPIDADAISVKSEIESVREVVEIILDEAPTLNAIVIPENATNGDIIKAIFPKDYVKIYDRSVSSWWNAPYKGV